MQSEEISKPWTTLCNRSKSCYRIWKLLWNFFTGETRNNLICIKIIGLLLQVQPVPNTIWPTVFSCPTLCPRVYPCHFILITNQNNLYTFYPVGSGRFQHITILADGIFLSNFGTKSSLWQNCTRKHEIWTLFYTRRWIINLHNSSCTCSIANFSDITWTLLLFSNANGALIYENTNIYIRRPTKMQILSPK